MIKAVLDTNVFVSALFWKGTPHKILQKGLFGDFTILTSAAIIEELQQTLLVKFGFPNEDTRQFLTLIAIHSAFAEPEEVPRVVLVDPNDDKVIACAIAGEAEYLVTGDRHLLALKKFGDITIVTPLRFLPLL